MYSCQRRESAKAVQTDSSLPGNKLGLNSKFGVISDCAVQVFAEPAASLEQSTAPDMQIVSTDRPANPETTETEFRRQTAE